MPREAMGNCAGGFANAAVPFVVATSVVINHLLPFGSLDAEINVGRLGNLIGFPRYLFPRDLPAVDMSNRGILHVKNNVSLQAVCLFL